MTGMTQTRVSKYELGVLLPTAEIALTIALALEVPVDQVFHGLAERASCRLHPLPTGATRGRPFRVSEAPPPASPAP